MAVLHFKICYIKTCSDKGVVHNSQILQKLNDCEKSGCTNELLNLDDCGLDDTSVRILFRSIEVRQSCLTSQIQDIFKVISLKKNNLRDIAEDLLRLLKRSSSVDVIDLRQNGRKSCSHF